MIIKYLYDVDNDIKEVHYKTCLNDVAGRSMSNQTNQQYKLRFLDDSDHQKLKAISKEDHLSINYLINKAVKQFLETVSSYNEDWCPVS